MKKGHYFSTDLKADPREAPVVGCIDAPPINAPRTAPQPSVRFDDPPHTTDAGAPGCTVNPQAGAAAPPAYIGKKS